MPVIRQKVHLMKITDELLEALGCKKCDLPGGRKGWVLQNRWQFVWTWKTDPLVDNGEKTWLFFTSMEAAIHGKPSHSVTHLGECLGMVAEDAFEAGKEERSREIREILDV